MNIEAPMDNNPILKQDAAFYYLGLHLALSKEGTRLPSVAELAQTLGLSAGLVQKAFQTLKAEGAVDIETRGHMGAYALSLDKKKLKQINSRQGFFCAMPLPYTLRYEALASALSAELSGCIPIHFMHVHGASRRIQLTEDGHADCALVSAHSWEHNPSSDLVPAFRFGEGSYLSRHVLVLSEGVSSENVRRVGVDAHSPDHQSLSRGVFPGGVEYIEINYPQIITALRTKAIDAAVLNYDEDRVHFFTTKELPPLPFSKAMGEAVLIVHRGNMRMLRACAALGGGRIKKNIQAVLDGSILPHY